MTKNKYPMDIAMVSILVQDPVKAFQYYTEVLGFEEVMYDLDNHLAIVKSTIVSGGAAILLEPSENGDFPIAKEYKTKIYEMGLPVISFSSENLSETVKELKSKGVKFKKDLTKTDWGYEAVFDDDNGNFI